MNADSTEMIRPNVRSAAGAVVSVKLMASTVVLAVVVGPMCSIAAVLVITVNFAIVSAVAAVLFSRYRRLCCH